MSEVNKSEYRRDIDGLRALAVLSVILFHMDADWLPGGFLGVDIFFVISGYLITGIIYREITLGSFSFLNFYHRRIKRILPAFFVVVITCLIVGYFILLPYDYLKLGRSSFSTVPFASNIYFAISSGGYFEDNSTLPLLHTWSLAVEEQYYFIWPVFLIALTKIGVVSRNIIYILITIAIASFVFATALAMSDSVFTRWNYYILPSRSGELLIGSILAILVNDGFSLRNRNYLGVLGAIAIALSLIFINNESIFPGINALWVCLGVAFIIASSPSNIVNRILSVQPLTYIGLISYSLYLWHWPVLAFMRYINPDNQVEQSLSGTALMIAAIATWALAHLTYILVERKTRNIQISRTKVFSFYFAIPSAVVLMAAGLLFVTQGSPSRFGDEAIAKTHHTPKTMCSKSQDRGCVLTAGDDSTRIALVGDSHAQSLETFFQLLGQENHYNIYDYASSACTPARPLDRVHEVSASHGELCEKARVLLDSDTEITDVVFLVGRWENNFFMTYDNSKDANAGKVVGYREKLLSEIRSLQDKGVNKIVLVNQIPKYKQNINKFLIPVVPQKYEVDELFYKANDELASIAESTSVFVVDFKSVFCVDNECSPLNAEGDVLYYDDDHLSIYGSQWLFEQYKYSDNYKKLIGYLDE